MVGGGIFSTLGVVFEIAGAWTWLSFAAAGLIAFAAGYSFVKLVTHYSLRCFSFGSNWLSMWDWPDGDLHSGIQ